ncbi:MAG: MqnA/MqnD/SBP family protein [Planctomycetota bacterium]
MPYGVGEPLVRGLADDPEVQLVRDVPRALIGQLRDGHLDAALVSSIEAFRRPGYVVLDDLGIACRTQARSVRAFVKPGVAIESVGLDDGSETSVALLRILLARRFGVSSCAFERIAPGLDADAYPHDVVLLIGDCGLRATTRTREIVDLGTAWHELTGMSFVFALWIMPPHADHAAVAACLRRAAGSGELRDATNGAIHYRLDGDDRRGLERFVAEASAGGLAAPGVLPQAM